MSKAAKFGGIGTSIHIVSVLQLGTFGLRIAKALLHAEATYHYAEVAHRLSLSSIQGKHHVHMLHMEQGTKFHVQQWWSYENISNSISLLLIPKYALSS